MNGPLKRNAILSILLAMAVLMMSRADGGMRIQVDSQRG